MRHGIQTRIANKAKISTAYISMILSGKRRPSWQNAKKLAFITKTRPELWLDGEPEKIKEILDAVNF